MSQYIEDVDFLGISDTDGYRWRDKSTNKVWAVPTDMASAISDLLLKLPTREEEKAEKRKNLQALVEDARKKNLPTVAEELERVLANL